MPYHKPSSAPPECSLVSKIHYRLHAAGRLISFIIFIGLIEDGFYEIYIICSLAALYFAYVRTRYASVADADDIPLPYFFRMPALRCTAAIYCWLMVTIERFILRSAHAKHFKEYWLFDARFFSYISAESIVRHSGRMIGNARDLLMTSSI